MRYWDQNERRPIEWQCVIAQPPEVPLLTLAEARQHLRMSECLTEDDDLISLLVAAATSELDGIDGWLGRALRPQQWRLVLDRFPRCGGRIRLPLTSPQPTGSPETVVVDSLTYLDEDDIPVAFADFTEILSSDPVYVVPFSNTDWPNVTCRVGAVEIVYNAGYAVIPELIRAYARLRVGQLYEFRELVAAGTSVAEIPYLRDSLECFRARWHAPI